MSYATQSDMEARFGIEQVLVVTDGLHWRGGWDADADYQKCDAVESAGTRWRARRDVDASETRPAAGEDWEAFGDLPFMVTVLGDAAAEIDAALAAAFALPLGDGPWPALAGIQCDLARIRLYRDNVPELVSEAAKAARMRLSAYVSANAQLVDGSGREVERTDQPRTASELPGVKPKKMKFSDEALEGY